jgi:hypothetical protein
MNPKKLYYEGQSITEVDTTQLNKGDKVIVKLLSGVYVGYEIVDPLLSVATCYVEGKRIDSHGIVDVDPPVIGIDEMTADIRIIRLPGVVAAPTVQDINNAVEGDGDQRYRA